ncbi:MAG: metal-dependent hydrolase [Bacteroidetes bacterium]|nr:MAG: metal-dependent hydrolase [Bacteroidota bacterium]
MDSLTQITLGAACGELVLGKKIGNRAMLWGAIGGTIPDLDVLANFFMSEMDALAFHRGITHSFFFAFTTPFLFGWLAWQFYRSGMYRHRLYKGLASGVWVLLLLLLVWGVNAIPVVATGSISLPTLFISLLVLGWILRSLWKDYLRSPLDEVRVGYREWVLLFFWSIFTHPLLDAFTAYGTQLFQPFSDYRVAFNTISVADPLYTAPFLLCLIGAAVLSRQHRWRRWLTWAGLGISSLYLLWTVGNRQYIHRVYAQSLAEQGIEATRFRITPTIFNNLLWQGVAETDTAFYFGLYSRLDPRPVVQLSAPIPKNHQLLDPWKEDEDVQLLSWFTEGYYGVAPWEEGSFILFDLRFGPVDVQDVQPERFVF